MGDCLLSASDLTTIMEPTKELGDQLYREEVLAARAMTPEDRVRVGTDLSRLTLRLAEDGIRNQYPDASAEDVARRLVERFELKRRLELSE